MKNMGQKIHLDEERASRTSTAFDQELRERSEPTGVFMALRNAAERRAAMKSIAVSSDEIEWLRGVVSAGEAAIEAVKSLLGEADQASRVVQTLKLKHHVRGRRIANLRRQ